MTQFAGTWAFSQRYIQNAVGGGTLVVDITPATNESILVKAYQCLGSTTNSETLKMRLIDIKGVTLIRLDQNVNTNPLLMGANLRVYSDDTASQQYALGFPQEGFLIDYPYSLRIDLTSVVQNDKLLIRFKAKIQSRKPTVAISSSGTIAADGTYTNDYDTVI